MPMCKLHVVATGGLLFVLCLFPSSTGAYTACTYCNLHCVVVHGGGDVIYVFVVGACGDAGCMQMWWQAI